MFGILIGIVGALVPLIGIFVSASIGIVLLKILVVLFVLTMILVMVSMIISPNIIVKLTVLPITFVVIMVGIIIYQSKAHVFFISSFGGDLGNAAMEIGEGVSIANSFMILQVGMFISFVPLIIAVIVKSAKLNKRSKIDFSTYNETQGTILNVVDAYTKINRVRLYNVTIDISSYQGESFQITKDFLIPTNIIHTIFPGKKITLIVNPEKKEDFYIKGEYGIL